jgi:putative urate catabolism protein
MAWQLAAGYGLEKFCRNVHATDLAVLELEKGNAAGLEKVIAACRRALMEDDSEAIVLGCAGMAPWHPAIQEALDVPVIDGVTAAVRQVESLVALGLATSKRQEWAHPIPKTYSGWLAALSPSPVSTQPRRPVVRLSRHEAPASAYPRDLVGYGRHPVQAQWPGNVRLSIQFVLNYEEGGESCVLHGDPISERFLSEIVSAEPYAARHMSMESIYEYGSRVGVWRILREFERRALPLTVFAVGMAIERHPDVGKAFVELGHEIACHGYKWIHYQHVPPDIEAAHMRQAMAAIERLTGTRPQGWYTGRDSPQTRRLVVEHGGFLYDSDYYGDDLPFWTTVSLENGTGMPHLVVPYTLDANDMRFATPQGFNTAQHFFEYLRDTFDVLYAEGGETPRMMSVGLHCRLIGRPGRLVALQRFLDHVERHDRVWVTRRIDIARHWHEHHPFPE